MICDSEAVRMRTPARLAIRALPIVPALSSTRHLTIQIPSTTPIRATRQGLKLFTGRYHNAEAPEGRSVSPRGHPPSYASLTCERPGYRHCTCRVLAGVIYR